HVAQTFLAADGQQPVIAKMNSLYGIEKVVLSVLRIVEVAIVGVEERTERGTDRRIGHLRGRFAIVIREDVQERVVSWSLGRHGEDAGTRQRCDGGNLGPVHTSRAIRITGSGRGFGS